MISLSFADRSALGALLVACLGSSCASPASNAVKADGLHIAARSPVFHGAKVNTGSVSCAHEGRRLVLTLSGDFVVPETPAPHWQVVDSRGNAFLLQRLMIKGDVLNRSIVVPEHVHDVAKVQIWCAYAETLLGETDLVCTHAMEAGAGFGHRTTVFAGPKVTRGTVRHELQDGKSVLVLSDDFVVPETPAPHWRLVDSRGNAYLLNRLVIKGDERNTTLVIPAYVPDVAKVQIWCAFAETLLGEAAFESPVR
jgi:hypothetical protein